MRTLSLLFALFIHGCSCSGAFAQNREVTGDIFPGLVAERNFVINGSFERGNQGVIAQSGTAVASTTNPIQGSRSLLISGVTTAGHTIRILYRGLQPGETGGDCILNFKYRGVGSAYKAYVYDTVTGLKLTEDITLSDESDPTKALKINPTVYKCPAASASPNAELRLEALVNTPGSLLVDVIESGAFKGSSQGIVSGSETLLLAQRTGSVQNVPTSAATTVIFNTVLSGGDPKGGFSTSNGVYTVRGAYEITVTGGAYMSAVAAGSVYGVQVLHLTAATGVTTTRCSGFGRSSSASDASALIPPCTFTVANGDLVYVRTDSPDGNYDIQPGTATYFSITGNKRFVTDVLTLVPDETVFSAEVNCSSSSSIISQSKQGWILSVGNVASGTCAVNFPTNQFTEGPSCEVTISSVGASQAVSLETGAVGTNGFTMYCFAGSPCASWTANIMCQRQDADYRAAQNRFINLKLGNIQVPSGGSDVGVRARWGGTTQPSNCTASPCTVYDTNTPGLTVTRVGTGTYRLNIPAGTFSVTPTCDCSAYQPASNISKCQLSSDAYSPTQRSIHIIGNVSASPVDGAGEILCFGSK